MDKGKDKSKKGSNPRIVTMDSIRSSPQDSERQAYFAGGSEHSGQQILGRGKRKNEQDFGNSTEGGDALAAAFRRASSSHAGERNVVSLHQGPRSFAGVGHRLGDSDNIVDETTPIVPIPTGTDFENPAQVILTLWENGYNIDDGPLQSYDDPKCAELMANVNRGELPTNILTSERMGPVHLAVVDNRGEKFKESVKVFGGKGHKLGSPTPSLTTTQVGTTSDEISSVTSDTFTAAAMLYNVNRSSSSTSNGNKLLKSEIDSLVSLGSSSTKSSNFDEHGGDVIFEDEEDTSGSEDVEYIPNISGSKRVFGGQGHVLERSDIPSSQTSSNSSKNMSVENNTDFSNGSDDTTIVKIRLPNGQIVQLTVTASSTIQEIKQYIKKCVPSLFDVNFSLNLTYPRRELRDDEFVNSGDINNSLLTLRM